MAIELENDELVVTLGNSDERVGIVVLDAERKEITRNEDCRGVHGEATAKDEAVVIGCENGVLTYRDGQITKVASPTEYGRIGNQAGSDTSPIVLGTDGSLPARPGTILSSCRCSTASASAVTGRAGHAVVPRW